MGARETYWRRHLADRHKAGAWETLLAAYDEPHRDYHSWRHIEHLIGELEAHRALVNRFDLVLAAIYWHDSVYRTRDADGSARPDAVNVRDSADLFRRYSAMSRADEDDVVSLIMGTSDHVGASAPAHLQSDLALFLDLDLSPLAIPWAQFRDNSRAIRREFAWVPEKEFLTGHIAVLDRFREAPRLYRRDETNAEWNRQARENLGRWIPELQKRLATV